MASAGGGNGPSYHQTETTPIEASGDACASRDSMGSHGCCKKTTSKAIKKVLPPAGNPDVSLFEFASSSSGTMNGCPLAMGRTAVVAKPHNSDAKISPASPNSFLRDLVTAEFTASLAPPLHLPNRGHTYLRCCTFLI